MKNTVVETAELSPYAVTFICLALGHYEEALKKAKKPEYDFESRTIRHVMGAFQFSGVVLTAPRREEGGSK